MKNNNADKVIKGKVDSFDTLSGGIVYGKEEAWEKLQGRMDKQPAKRIALKYGLAAAVLVLVCVSGVYFYPAKEYVNNRPLVRKQERTNLPVTPATVITQPETTAVYTSVSIHSAHKVPHAAKVWDTSTAPQAPEVVVENKTAVQPTIVTVVKKPMKVVHINDLGNEVSTTSIAITPIVPLPSIAKMRVVHINELGADRVQKQMDDFVLKYENSFAANKQTQVTNGKVNTFHSPLKIKFTTQN